MARSDPRPYANPYVAGVCLGLVLLGAYAVAGRGLGASGGFAAAGAGRWNDWVFVELAGVVAGGLMSSILARRWQLTIDRGAGVSSSARLFSAAGGGFAMGVGAVFARGCTSGQALTGGAMLSVGSWLFIAGAFGSAYAFAWPVRKFWR